MTKRSTGNLLAVLLLLPAGLWPDSRVAQGWRELAVAYIFIDLVVRAVTGVRRRRSYWTAESWRRYATVCVIAVGALLIMSSMMMALEWRLPIVGASHSATRGFWAAVVLVFMLIGTVGLVGAIESLHYGDPATQFLLPRWLTIGRRKTA